MPDDYSALLAYAVIIREKLTLDKAPQSLLDAFDKLKEEFDQWLNPKIK